MEKSTLTEKLDEILSKLNLNEDVKNSMYENITKLQEISTKIEKEIVNPDNAEKMIIREIKDSIKNAIVGLTIYIINSSHKEESINEEESIKMLEEIEKLLKQNY